ncbi:decaheme-associated outer membrane protein, MtrB/PioB family [Burkholderiales bacterium JOSHI_001]|nr:decaheme-associated outer membrane protein, MtrB/PioB family [Burkholderiales bacterium JOSHI_001]
MSTPFPRTLLALAAAATLATFNVQAEDLPASEGSVSVGAGLLTTDRPDRALFGQYNGLGGRARAFGVLDLDLTRRDAATGTEWNLLGNRLANDTRDLSLTGWQQGQWKLRASFAQSLRREPLSVSTSLQGAGSTTPLVQAPGGGPLQTVDLKIRRTRLGLGFSQWLSPDWQLDLSLQTERRQGARLWGTGMTCPSVLAPTCRGSTGIQAGWALLMLPEPLQSNHTQVEARLAHAAEHWQLSLGYQGALFDNGLGSLRAGLPAQLNGPLGQPLPLSPGLAAWLAVPVALAPDNQSHRLDLTGRWEPGPRLRLNATLAHTLATQQSSFDAAGLAGAPAGAAQLNARLDTTLARLGLWARPVPALSLTGSVRWEDVRDKTPLATYVVVGDVSGTNRQLPNTRLRAQADALWQFAPQWRASLGAEHESIDRGLYTASANVVGVNALRQNTQENGLRLELRRNMTETLSSALSLSASQRSGSQWLRPNAANGVTPEADPAALGATALYMPTLADRRREGLKWTADWQVNDDLSLQGALQAGHDRYLAPTGYGLQRTRMNQFNLDASYALNATWTVTGQLSRSAQALVQAKAGGALTTLDNTQSGAGFGVAGKLFGKVQVGAELGYLNDRSRHRQSLDALAGADSAALLAASGGLPDVVLRQSTLKAFGRWAPDKTSTLQLDLSWQRSVVRDWTWGLAGSPFTYADGSTVWQRDRQTAVALGIRYTRSWQ